MLAGVLLATALLALAGMLSRNKWLLGFVVPQQIVLYMTAAGAVTAMYLGQFADGTVRAQPFMIADQIHSVLAAVTHTWALVNHVRYRLSDKMSEIPETDDER